jgi:hypothetical protein
LDLLFKIERSQIAKPSSKKRAKSSKKMISVWKFKRDDRVHRLCDSFHMTGVAAGWAAQHEKTTTELFALASGGKRKNRTFQELIERVVSALEPIGEVFSDFTRWERKKEQCWQVLVLRAVQLAIEDRLEVTLKKDFTWAHAIGMGKDCGLTPQFFFGQFRRIIKVHSMRSNINLSKHSMCFIRSLYETKRCWQKLPAVFEREAMEKHKRCMTTPAVSTEEALKYIRSTVDLVVPPIADCALQMPPSQRVSEQEHMFVPGGVLPTYSASYETSRKKGGNHGALSHGFTRAVGLPHLPRDLKEIFECRLHRTHKESDLDPSKRDSPCPLKEGAESFASIELDNLVHITYHPYCTEGVCRANLWKVNDFVNFIGDQLGPEEQCRKRSYDQGEEYLVEASQQDNRVRYQALPEPGKYRIITAGRQHLYTGLQTIQKFLLASWKKVPVGTMVTDVEQRILEQMHGPKEALPECYRSYQDVVDQDCDEECFVSGDYSSATDLMHLDATLCAVDRIIENLRIGGTLLATEFRRSFEGALVEYPDGDVLQQVRGQLMGHPCSFPILCIINLSTYCRIYNITQPEDLERRRVLINGDDILFKGSPGASLQWRKCAAEVGLQINEEKTYNHPHWHLINSILGDNKNTVPYYARSLAIGHRIKSEPVMMVRTLPALERFLARYPVERGRKRLFRFLLSTIHGRLTQSDFRFVYTDKKGKQQKTDRFRRNFFLPKQLGGLGLENRTGASYHITTAQQKLATYILREDPDFIGFQEKISEVPSACALAVQKVHKMKPAVTLMLDSHGRHVEGPLNFLEDPDRLEDMYLRLALDSTKWKLNSNSSDAEYRMQVLDVPIPKEKTLIKKSKLKRLRPARTRVVSQFDWQPQEVLAERVSLAASSTNVRLADTGFSEEQIQQYHDYLPISPLKREDDVAVPPMALPWFRGAVVQF